MRATTLLDTPYLNTTIVAPVAPGFDNSHFVFFSFMDNINLMVIVEQNLNILHNKSGKVCKHPTSRLIHYKQMKSNHLKKTIICYATTSMGKSCHCVTAWLQHLQAHAGPQAHADPFKKDATLIRQCCIQQRTHVHHGIQNSKTMHLWGECRPSDVVTRSSQLRPNEAFASACKNPAAFPRLLSVHFRRDKRNDRQLYGPNWKATLQNCALPCSRNRQYTPKRQLPRSDDHATDQIDLTVIDPWLRTSSCCPWEWRRAAAVWFSTEKDKSKVLLVGD